MTNESVLSESARVLIDACKVDDSARRTLSNDGRGGFRSWLAGIALTAGSSGIQSATFSGSNIVEQAGQQTADIRVLALVGRHLLVATCRQRPNAEPADVEVSHEPLRAIVSWRVTSDIQVGKLATDGLPEYHATTLDLETLDERKIVVSTRAGDVASTTDFILALTGALAKA